VNRTRPAVKRILGWRLFWQSGDRPLVPAHHRTAARLVMDAVRVIMPLGSVIAYVLVYRALKAPEEYVGLWSLAEP